MEMRNRVNIIFLVWFALAMISVTGCMVGPKFTAPALDTPDQFRYDQIKGDSTISTQWFDLLNDPTLSELVKTALKNNKNLLMAASRIEQSRAYLGFTKADMLPSIGYTGQADFSNFNQNTGKMESFEMYTAGASLSWEIDFWGKFRRANEAARAELIASEFAQEWIKLNLMADVAINYFSLVDFDRRLAISERTLESRNESMDIVYQRFEKGIAPELDYNQAQIQQAIAAQAVPFFKRQVAITENSLAILLGQNPGPIVRSDMGVGHIVEIDVPVGLPSDILLRRPDVQEAIQQLKAQNARIGVAQAMRFPSISLTGMFGAVSNDLSTMGAEGGIYQLTGGLLGPVFHFGKNKRRVEMEREKTNQVRLNYEQTVLVTFQEVENALISVDTYNKEYEAIFNQRKAAENAAKLSAQRYDGGVTSYLEVLDSERTLFQSELTASEVNKQKLEAYIRLYKALGGGWRIPTDLIEE
ncbi:efflux transporter outer membrane subunit [Labilibacter sediminis]|nr:efflux transporter outer membrane subunit [Labilibacter sediminis]